MDKRRCQLLGLYLNVINIFLGVQPAWSQAVPDTTLGSELSGVNGSGVNGFAAQPERELVTGGAVRGKVLFHSFSELNVGEGRSLYFTHPSGISQIFSRVTGSSPSKINGTLGVLGNADLYLLNPNGVLFGPNARLDLSGSFTATTATSVKIGGLEFSAVSPSAPPFPPLLNLSVQPGLQWGAVASDSRLQNQGSLAVEAGRSLSFMAGQIDQTGTILAPGGTVTLQGETFSLTGSIDTRDSLGKAGALRLISPLDLQIKPTGPLTNGAIAQALLSNSVVIEAAGDLTLAGPLSSTVSSPLTLQAGNDLFLTPGNRILAGDVTLISGRDISITDTLKLNGAQPHQLTIQAGGDVRLQNAALPNDTVGDQRSNPPSLTTIQANNLMLDNTELSGFIYGLGDGANLVIQVQDTVVLQGSIILTFVSAGSLGNAGGITIQARRLQLDGSSGQRSSIASTTDLLTPGNAGNITLDASDSIELVGSLPGPFNAVAFRAAELIDLAQAGTTITSSAFGAGQSGNITIETDRLLMRDGVALGIVPGIFATARGQEGNVTIAARETQLQGLAVIGSLTLGATDAGDVTIRGDRLSLNDGAVMSVNSIGVNTLAGSGDAGELRVDVRELNVLKGSFLSAGTDTPGAGGNLIVNADTVTVAGTSADGIFPSALRTDVGTGFGLLDPAIATGKGGQLILNANQLQVFDGAQILASTNSKGDAGNVEITAKTVEVRGTGPSGIPSLLAAESNGMGAAGTLKVTADQLTIRDRAQASTQSRQGDGGNINLSLTDVLYLRRQGRITATAGIDGAGGDGGNINIKAGFIVAPPNEDTDISANAFEGSGGNVTIQTNTLLGAEPRDRATPRSDITASSELGVRGQVTVDVLAPQPDSGLVELPIALLNESQQVANECKSTAQSRFVLTGRGGIPADPRQQLQGQMLLQDWRGLENGASAGTGAGRTAVRPYGGSMILHRPIEAQALRRDRQGRIQLVSQRPQIPATARLSCSMIEQANQPKSDQPELEDQIQGLSYPKTE